MTGRFGRYKLLDRSPMAAVGAALDGVGHLARYGASGFGVLHAGPIDDRWEGVARFFGEVASGNIDRNSIGRAVAAGMMRESLGQFFGTADVLGLSEEPPSLRDVVILACNHDNVTRCAEQFPADEQIDAALLADDGRPWAIFEVQYGRSDERVRTALDQLGRLAYFTAPSTGSIGLACLIVVIPERSGLEFHDSAAELARLVETEFGYQAKRSTVSGPPFLIRSPKWICCDGTVRCPQTGELVHGFGAVAISYAYALA